MDRMQPTAYPVDHGALRHGWESFRAQGELPPALQERFDPAVLKSWQRCALRAGSTPSPKRLQAMALDSMMRAHADLIAVAIPFMEDVHQFLESSHCAILLTNSTACVLALAGDGAAVAELTDLGLDLGAYWSEGQLGTNALGMCLLEAMPVQVVGAEHYFPVFQHLVTSAAPIHHVNGRMIGILGLVTPAASATSHTLSLAMAVARAITGQFQADLILEEANRRLSEMHTVLGAVDEGVITWNEAGQVNHVNAQAARILRLNPASVLGQVVTDVLELPQLLREAIGQNRELQDVEVTFNVNGRAVPCLLSLRPITAGMPQGHIAMLRPIEHVRRLVQEQVGAQSSLKLEAITGRSPAMRQVLRQARTAARGTAPVLLRGEGGVGKNYLARAIHNDGERSEGPFLAINCRAIPHELMPEEMLGYEGEGVTKGRPSKFELANGGTLLLDQIENLSLEMQAAVLHLLETGFVMRLGSLKPIPVDVRLVALTSADLERLVTAGHFLSHLYYRFGVFSLAVPPLRDRPEDIPILIERFLDRLSSRTGRSARLHEEALEVLCRYPWPGNVRELESALERALYQCDDGLMRLIDLPAVVRTGRVITASNPAPAPVLTIGEAEREAIIRAGWACEGRVTEMARQLGIGRTTLWRKLKRYDITPDHFAR